MMQAAQEIKVGGSWGFQLYPGETAFLDKDDKVLEIQDAQGRVKLENLGDDRFRYYAWEGGYDLNVGFGELLLEAGNSYTFEWSGVHGNPQQVEIRLISNDQLVGYALLIMTFDSNGSYTGFEIPIAFVDGNGDGLVSIQELDTALAGLREEVKVIAESQPSLAASFETDIASAYAATHSGAIADAYQKIKQIQLELASAVQAVRDQIAKDQAVKDQAAKDQKTAYISIAMAFVILFVAAFLLARRRRPGMRTQHVNITPGIPKKAVKRHGPVENHKGDPESTGKPCPKCGYHSHLNDLYCIKCGEKLK